MKKKGWKKKFSLFDFNFFILQKWAWSKFEHPSAIIALFDFEGDASHVYDHALIHPAPVPPPTVEFGPLLLPRAGLLHHQTSPQPDRKHRLHVQQYRQPTHLLSRIRNIQVTICVRGGTMAFEIMATVRNYGLSWKELWPKELWPWFKETMA